MNNQPQALQSSIDETFFREAYILVD
jgi:hypothetical protein